MAQVHIINKVIKTCYTTVQGQSIKRHFAALCEENVSHYSCSYCIINSLCGRFDYVILCHTLVTCYRTCKQARRRHLHAAARNIRMAFCFNITCLTTQYHGLTKSHKRSQ